MEFQTFDNDYVQRLAAGDPATEAHFSAYFDKFLSLKLRSRRLTSHAAEDAKQETLFRVLKALRKGSGVSQPERFGAFVNSVCNNVLLERGHRQTRDGVAPEEPRDYADTRIDINAALITDEQKRLVARVLDELAPKDREILRLVFFEEADRREVSQHLKVEPEYLRVLLHRAKAKFQAAYVKKTRGLTTQIVMIVCNVIGAYATTR